MLGLTCDRWAATSTTGRPIKDAALGPWHSHLCRLSLVRQMRKRHAHGDGAFCRAAPATDAVLAPRTAAGVAQVVEVDLGERSYPIYIGAGLLDDSRLLQQHIPGKRVLVVTNETIAPLYLDRCDLVCAAREHAAWLRHKGRPSPTNSAPLKHILAGARPR